MEVILAEYLMFIKGKESGKESWHGPANRIATEDDPEAAVI